VGWCFPLWWFLFSLLLFIFLIKYFQREAEADVNIFDEITNIAFDTDYCVASSHFLLFSNIISSISFRWFLWFPSLLLLDYFFFDFDWLFSLRWCGFQRLFLLSLFHWWYYALQPQTFVRAAIFWWLSFLHFLHYAFLFFLYDYFWCFDKYFFLYDYVTDAASIDCRSPMPPSIDFISRGGRFKISIILLPLSSDVEISLGLLRSLLLISCAEDYWWLFS